MNSPGTSYFLTPLDILRTFLRSPAAASRSRTSPWTLDSRGFSVKTASPASYVSGCLGVSGISSSPPFLRTCCSACRLVLVTVTTRPRLAAAAVDSPRARAPAQPCGGSPPSPPLWMGRGGLGRPGARPRSRPWLVLARPSPGRRPSALGPRSPRPRPLRPGAPRAVQACGVRGFRGRSALGVTPKPALPAHSMLWARPSPDPVKPPAICLLAPAKAPAAS